MSLATICRSAAIRCGLTADVPAVWVGNTDPTARELVEFADEALRMVVEAFEWEALLRDFSAALTGATRQVVPLPADWGRLVPGTAWLEGLLRPIVGPVSEVEFERLARPPAALAQSVFRLAGGALEIMPGVAAASSFSLRYVTGFPVRSAAGAGQLAWQADADVALVDERVILLALVALWRDAKGLDAQVASAQYAGALAKAKAHDRPLGVMTMGGFGGRTGSPVALGNGTTVLTP